MVFLEVRRYQSGEERAIWSVYYGSTHHVVSQRYTLEQVQRWAPDEYDSAAWTARLKRSNPFVAVLDGQIVGFAELLDSGEIEYFYCHHEFQRQGVGRALMRELLSQAEQAGLPELTANVSLTAVDFFLSQGFRITGETNNVVCGQPARQFQMAMTTSADDG